jgi:dihydroneopterin aldolase
MFNFSDPDPTEMTTIPTSLDGLVPASLAPKSRRIFLKDYDLPVDIGFHDFEIGKPQRLLISVEVWVDEASFAARDSEEAAWNYDFLRTEIGRMVEGRRFNLQETLVREIYDLIAARAGVTGLRVLTCKPDIYEDCGAVGVELSSF